MKGQPESFGGAGLLCILILVLVMWICTCVKTHEAANLESPLILPGVNLKSKQKVAPEEYKGLVIVTCLLLTTVKHLKPYFIKCGRPCQLVHAVLEGTGDSRCSGTEQRALASLLRFLFRFPQNKVIFTSQSRVTKFHPRIGWAFLGRRVFKTWRVLQQIYQHPLRGTRGQNIV